MAKHSLSFTASYDFLKLPKISGFWLTCKILFICIHLGILEGEFLSRCTQKKRILQLNQKSNFLFCTSRDTEHLHIHNDREDWKQWIEGMAHGIQISTTNPESVRTSHSHLENVSTEASIPSSINIHLLKPGVSMNQRPGSRFSNLSNRCLMMRSGLSQEKVESDPLVGHKLEKYIAISIEKWQALKLHDTSLWPAEAQIQNLTVKKEIEFRYHPMAWTTYKIFTAKWNTGGRLCFMGWSHSPSFLLYLIIIINISLLFFLSCCLFVFFSVF